MTSRTVTIWSNPFKFIDGTLEMPGSKFWKPIASSRLSNHSPDARVHHTGKSHNWNLETQPRFGDGSGPSGPSLDFKAFCVVTVISEINRHKFSA